MGDSKVPEPLEEGGGWGVSYLPANVACAGVPVRVPTKLVMELHDGLLSYLRQALHGAQAQRRKSRLNLAASPFASLHTAHAIPLRLQHGNHNLQRSEIATATRSLRRQRGR